MKRLNITALAAEAQLRTADSGEQRDRAHSKALSGRQTPRQRKLKHKIGTRAAGGLSTGKFGKHRGFPALDEVPGHHAHSQCVRAEGAAGLGKLVQVPAVEGVIFTYDTGYIHLKVSE